MINIWRKRLLTNRTLICVMLIMAVGYVLMHDLLGGTLFAHCQWDSYTLQALAWLRGSVSLGQDYPWLELAIYNGDFYVSFPPLPSVVMLPFALVFSEATPNNLIMALYAMATSALCYKLLRRTGTTELCAAVISIFYVWGSNLMWMSTLGGVWFQAQALNFLLLTGAVYAAFLSKRILSYVLVALAVGCRPFSACVFIPLFVWYFTADRDAHKKSVFRTALMQWKCFIAPVLIACVYMWYNYVRFESVLEFGHNYLPEFMSSESGQFSLSYIPQNLYNLFIRPVVLRADASLEYTFFDGFMFYVANPMYIVLFIRMVTDAVKKKMDVHKLALMLAMLLMIVLTCAHKTLGGWQFGARYTVDMLPLALWYLIRNGEWRLKRYEYVIAAFAVMFNIYGALAMTYLYS